MQVIIVENKEAVAKEAAQLIKKAILAKPNLVLGLATGSSPIGLYEKLIEAYKNQEVSFKDVVGVNLDEYVGLAPDHDQSYAYFMRKNLFDYIDIDLKNTYIPNGMATDLEVEAKHYDEILDRLKIDLQLLGIGTNGHIGFNEPGTSFEKTTHLTDLAESTLLDNARFFEHIEEVPTQALTMGIASILKAKQIVLIATGKNKAAAIKAMVQEPVSEALPASILQNHDDVVVIIDKEAASEL